MKDNKVSETFSGATVTANATLEELAKQVFESARQVQTVYEACCPLNSDDRGSFFTAWRDDPSALVRPLTRVIASFQSGNPLTNKDADYGPTMCAVTLSGVERLVGYLAHAVSQQTTGDAVELAYLYADFYEGRAGLDLCSEGDSNAPLLAGRRDKTGRLMITGRDLYCDLLGMDPAHESVRECLRIPGKSDFSPVFLRHFTVLYAIRKSGLLENVRRFIDASEPDFAKRVLQKQLEYSQTTPARMIGAMEEEASNAFWGVAQPG